MSLALRNLETKMIARGPKPLLHRIGFLMRASGNDRAAKLGRYMETRISGAKLPGRNKRRRGTYDNVYAQPGKVRV